LWHFPKGVGLGVYPFASNTASPRTAKIPPPSIPPIPIEIAWNYYISLDVKLREYVC
jgi:hypothetical protein